MLKTIPQDQENMTINDLVFRIQSIKTNYYKQVNQESEVYLVKLFFFLYNCVNKFNKLFTFINLRLNSTSGLRQFLNAEFNQLRRKIKELNNLKKYGLFKKIGQHQQQQEQQQQVSLFHSQNVELMNKQNRKVMADSQYMKIPSKQNRQSQFEDEIQPFLIQSYKENVKIFLKEFPNKNKEAKIYAQQFQDNLYLQYFIDQHERKVFMFQVINNMKDGKQSLKQVLMNQFAQLKQKALVNIKKEMEFIFQFHQEMIEQSQELKELKIRDIQEIDQSFNYNVYLIKRNKMQKFRKNKRKDLKQDNSIDTMNISQNVENKENKVDVSENENNTVKMEMSYQGDKRQLLIDSLNHQNQNDSMQYQNGIVTSRPTYMKDMTKKDIEMFNKKRTVQLDYQQQVLKLVSRDRQYRNKTFNSTSQGFAYSKNYQQISKLKKYQQLTPIHVDFENEKDEHYSTNMKRFRLSVVNQTNLSIQESRKNNRSVQENRRDSDIGMRNSYMTNYQHNNSNSKNLSKQSTQKKSLYNEQEEPNKQHRKLNRFNKQANYESRQQSYLRFRPSNRTPQSLGKQILAKLDD